MKKKTIAVMTGSIGAILAIFAFVFAYLEKNPDSGEQVNLIGKILIVTGIAIVLLAALIAAKKKNSIK